VLKIRGLHILAGIAAGVLAALLGMSLGLSNTATFMFIGVAYVAVSMWTEGWVAKRRRGAAGLVDGVVHPDLGADSALPLEPDDSKREGQGG
jgi:hypothetical protein